MRGLLKLTWLEIKIFVREPLGLFGTVGVPVLVFVVMSRILGARVARGRPPIQELSGSFVPVLASILIALSAVVSLVTVVAIYREGGILKRLRATPLRPQTILTAHVIVKLLFTAVTLAAMVLAGRRAYPAGAAADVPWAAFAVALLFVTGSILSMGFLIASLVPTARFAQPVAAVILYPMMAVSGLFTAPGALPPAVEAAAQLLPLTHAVSLLEGIWNGQPWSAHLGDLAALAVTFIVCTALSARVFRWE
jgi:ABC-2 type transport system permease protein